jgi:hypothetical protein
MAKAKKQTPNDKLQIDYRPSAISYMPSAISD